MWWLEVESKVVGIEEIRNQMYQFYLWKGDIGSKKVEKSDFNSILKLDLTHG